MTSQTLFDSLDNQKEHLSDMAAAEDAQGHRFTTAQAALEFMLAGNAYFTLRSRKTGTRYTFRMNQPKKSLDASCRFCKRTPCDCEPVYFVSLLTGPQNTEDYSYMGIVRCNEFKLTSKSKMQPDSAPVRAFGWAFAKLTVNELPDSLEIWHEGRCGRCGRVLTVPDSIEAGIGPDCASKMGGAQ